MSKLNILKLSISNSNQDAYFAYLQIFDANHKKQRKELLKQILSDSHISVLFFKNCHPSEDEKELAFDSITNDVDSTFLFLKECRPEGKYREECLKILLCVDDYAYAAVKICNLSSEERLQIYRRYNNKWHVTTDLQEYFDYCTLFEECLTLDEIDLLVNMIYEQEDAEKTEYILTSTFKLTEYQKDKLESLFIVRKLKGEPNETINC